MIATVTTPRRHETAPVWSRWIAWFRSGFGETVTMGTPLAAVQRIPRCGHFNHLSHPSLIPDPRHSPGGQVPFQGTVANSYFSVSWSDPCYNVHYRPRRFEKHGSRAIPSHALPFYSVWFRSIPFDSVLFRLIPSRGQGGGGIGWSLRVSPWPGSRQQLVIAMQVQHSYTSVNQNDQGAPCCVVSL